MELEVKIPLDIMLICDIGDGCVVSVRECNAHYIPSPQSLSTSLMRTTGYRCFGCELTSIPKNAERKII